MRRATALLLLAAMLLAAFTSCVDNTNYAQVYGVQLPTQEKIEYVDDSGKTVNEIMKESVLNVLETTFKDIENIFFGKQLLFTEDKTFCNVKDLVVYTVTDWTNEDVFPSAITFDADDIYSSIMKRVGYLENNMGDSFETLAQSLSTVLKDQLAINKEYKFSKMAPEYEYRIVIRADFSYYTSAETYQVGIVNGTWDAIVQMIGGNFEDLGENYSYMKLMDELKDVSNVRFSVEYREKAGG